MKFKRGPGVAGVKAILFVGSHEKIELLDLSGFKIHEDFAKWDPEQEFTVYVKARTRTIDMGPNRAIPVIIPWNHKFYLKGGV